MDKLGGSGANPPDGGPPDGGRSGGGLPGLPPEWGIIVVPDDLSELAEESAQVRRELRQEARRQRRRWSPREVIGPDPYTRLSGLVVFIALFAMLTGLFSLGFAGNQRVGTSRPTTSAAAGPRTKELPALDLIDRDGHAVSVRSLLPAVILLVDGCRCHEVISGSATAAPRGVSVLVIARTVPNLAGLSAGPQAARPTDLHALADPAGELRAVVGPPPSSPTSGGALLVTATAKIVRTVPETTSVDDFRTDLDQLAPG